MRKTERLREVPRGSGVRIGERVARYAAMLGQHLNHDAEACERLYLTGLLHDIGKIAVPDATLGKPGRLTDDEFKTIMLHPDEGWAILIGLDQLKYVLPGVLYHHERYDGKGYPDGLTGEDIPLDGRILAVADAYDAMTSDRPYRKGMSHERAEALLFNGAGTQWDQDIVDALLAAGVDVTNIREGFRQEPRPARQPGSTIQEK